jgi:hypothetical protein
MLRWGNHDDSHSDKFSSPVIRKLAEDSKLPPSADLALFGNFVRVAAALYLEERGWASSAKIRADVKAIQRAAKPINEQKKTRQPHLIIKVLREASPETIQMLRGRAMNRGDRFPSDDDLTDPARLGAAVRTLDALTRAGGSVNQGRKRPTGKVSTRYNVELYAPVSPRNFAKREAERVAIKRLRAAWRWAVARGDTACEAALSNNMPSISASFENPGPFVRLARGFFKELGVEEVDVAHLINSTDFAAPQG